jgi:hypothetical protein
MFKIIYDPRLDGGIGLCWVVMDRATELGRFFNMARAARNFPNACIDGQSFGNFLDDQAKIAEQKGLI